MVLHPALLAVTDRIMTASKLSRSTYLAQLDAAQEQGVARSLVSCTNLAHGFASAGLFDKLKLKEQKKPCVAIVSAYNDILSAHQPFEHFPELIKQAVRAAGGVARFAGGVPAMCDGVTQGQAGMQLSLFSRDTIALSTAIALSHNLFDAALYLGVCDKIVPGLLIGALHFGHLPAVFVPAGPMTSGMSNTDKAKQRQLYAQGKIGREQLLEAEAQSYHSPGTCTFYGTANSNQLLMQAMGLHLPGAAFVTPNTPLRDALTSAAAKRAIEISLPGSGYTPIGKVVSEKTIVNAIVALLATGGSSNHTLHLVAIAKAAGIVIDWDDFEALSKITPLLARIYPNGLADVNHFHAAGGTSFVIRELLDAGLMHNDVMTILGQGLYTQCAEPFLEQDKLIYKPTPATSQDDTVLRSVNNPFDQTGGLRLLQGNIGRAILKTSSVAPEHLVVSAPAMVFSSYTAFVTAYAEGKLQKDFIAVLPYQGPRANGMPELHGLTPMLKNLQDAGYHVALVTDGRMSGASGQIPEAIHVCPEALMDGVIGLICDGDDMVLDGVNGQLRVLVPDHVLKERLSQRVHPDLSMYQHGVGRSLFGAFRQMVASAEEGASIIIDDTLFT